MRKLFLIGLLVIAIPAICLAADTAHAVAVSGDIGQVVAIGDGSSGSLAEVSSTSGALNVANRSQAITDAMDSNSLGEDTLVYTGACRIQGVYITGETAGDWAAVYDAVSKTGQPKFDPRISANTSSTWMDCKGAPMATGIYVDVLDDQVLATVVYDY